MSAPPLSQPPMRGPILGPKEEERQPFQPPSRLFAAWMRDVSENMQQRRDVAAINDADGTLADLTTKFNQLLAHLRDVGFLRE